MSGCINSLRFRLREPPGPCSICSFRSEPSAELLGLTPPFRICRVCVAENLAHVDPSAEVAALDGRAGLVRTGHGGGYGYLASQLTRPGARLGSCHSDRDLVIESLHVDFMPHFSRTWVGMGPAFPAAMPRAQRKLSSVQRGFTLIEMLVVISIIGVVAAIVGVNVMGADQTARIDVTTAQISQVAGALDLYRLKFHTYPATAEGLQALVRPPRGGPPVMKTVPRDAWDAPLRYSFPGSTDPSTFDLRSNGPDGVADTPDDLPQPAK